MRARSLADNSRHYARIAQLPRHFYGRLFLRSPSFLERARSRSIRNQTPRE